jgi:AcrR family transcriptional regulator
MTPRPATTGEVPARAARADARRNIAAILDAAEDCLVRNPEATVAEIAKAAGVGRVTLYGHFPTRADLVEAVFRRVTERADEALDSTDTSGDPVAAVSRLAAASWQIVHRFRAILAAAERELPADRIRAHHDRHLARLTALIERGRHEGVFRTDLSVHWLVTVAYTLMHAAAAETSSGHVDAAGAERAVIATVLSAYAPPA